MMGTDALFESGKLKRVQKSPERAKKSLAAADKYLREARLALGAGANEVSIIGSYSAAFHAARAILYLDGVEENAHYAVYEYLREKHSSLGSGEISRFNMYRKFSHGVAYGLESESSGTDAKAALEFAEGFVSKVKSYLKI
jgi:uncharacterized protein (UPF0332 family)